MPKPYRYPNCPKAGKAESKCNAARASARAKVRYCCKSTAANTACPPIFSPSAPAPTPATPQPPNPITVDDFNFDGRPDIAVPRGQQGPYGSWSDDIYLQTEDGNLLKSQELSELSDYYMGTPEIDRKRKLLIVYGKSGAAIHYTAHYRVTPDGSLQQVYQRDDIHGGCKRQTGIKIEETTISANGKQHTRTRCLTEAQYEKQIKRDLEETRPRRPDNAK